MNILALVQRPLVVVDLIRHQEVGDGLFNLNLRVWKKTNLFMSVVTHTKNLKKIEENSMNSVELSRLKFLHDF